MPQTIQCFLLGLLGMAIYILGVKMPATLKRAKAANIEMGWKEYFKHDARPILLSVLTIIAVIAVQKEILHYKPGVMNFIKSFYICIGFMGSNLAIAALGKASGLINKIIDVKTDKADGITKVE